MDGCVPCVSGVIGGHREYQMPGTGVVSRHVDTGHPTWVLLTVKTSPSPFVGGFNIQSL